MQTSDADVNPMHVLSMRMTYDARRRCKTSVHHARCTMHRLCITTTWRCRVRARGRRRCSRWCRLTILYNNVPTSRHTSISARRRMHEQYCTIRRMHEHCQHWLWHSFLTCGDMMSRFYTGRSARRSHVTRATTITVFHRTNAHDVHYTNSDLKNNYGNTEIPFPLYSHRFP